MGLAVADLVRAHVIAGFERERDVRVLRVHEDTFQPDGLFLAAR